MGVPNSPQPSFTLGVRVHEIAKGTASLQLCSAFKCTVHSAVFRGLVAWNGKKLALTLTAMRTLFALFGEHHTLSCIGKVLRHLIPYKSTGTSPFIWLLCCAGSHCGALSARLTLATFQGCFHHILTNHSVAKTWSRGNTVTSCPITGGHCWEGIPKTKYQISCEKINLTHPG